MSPDPFTCHLVDKKELQCKAVFRTSRLSMLIRWESLKVGEKSFREWAESMLKELCPEFGEEVMYMWQGGACEYGGTHSDELMQNGLASYHGYSQLRPPDLAARGVVREAVCKAFKTKLDFDMDERILFSMHFSTGMDGDRVDHGIFVPGEWVVPAERHPLDFPLTRKSDAFYREFILPTCKEYGEDPSTLANFAES